MKTRYLFLIGPALLALGFWLGYITPRPAPTQAQPMATPVASETRTETTPATVPVRPVAVANTASSSADGPWRRFEAKPGGRVRIEGTSTMHDWQVEGKLIGGTLMASEGFPAPGSTVAQAQTFIPVRSLTSVKADGTPYSTAMDDIMYDKLRSGSFPRIQFYFSGLNWKTPAPDTNGCSYFEAKGQLVVAGVTNQVQLPITVSSLPDGKVKISGSLPAKMTDFNIEPPSPTFGVVIKTGNEVKLIFDWIVAEKVK